VKTGSTVIAGAVWYVANHSEQIPRFTKEQMPPPVAGRGGAAAANPTTPPQ
jgi:hypothetical protein